MIVRVRNIHVYCNVIIIYYYYYYYTRSKVGQKSHRRPRQTRLDFGGVVFTVVRGGVGGKIFFLFLFHFFFPSQSADQTHCRHVAVTARAVCRLALVTVAVVVVQPSSSSSGRRARILYRSWRVFTCGYKIPE